MATVVALLQEGNGLLQVGDDFGSFGARELAIDVGSAVYEGAEDFLHEGTGVAGGITGVFFWGVTAFDEGQGGQVGRPSMVAKRYL